MGIGCAMFVLVIIMFNFYHKSKLDDEWCQIDDFLEHRNVKWTSLNALALSNIALTFFQLSSLSMTVLVPPRANEADQSSYDKAKIWIVELSDIFLLDMDFDVIEKIEVRVYATAGPFLTFCSMYGQLTFAISCVLAWWLLYGGLSYGLLHSARPFLACGGSQEYKMNSIARRIVYKSVAEHTIYRFFSVSYLTWQRSLLLLD